MSEPDPGFAAALAATPDTTNVALLTGSADIVELACHRGREAGLRALAESRGRELPGFGHAASRGGQVALCVRPGRWLLLQPKRGSAGGESAAREWEGASQGLGTAVDLSAALSLLLLQGPGAVELLDRHCRLDLRREHFGAGSAAASLMAQVPIIIVACARGLLVATPTSTSRHFCEWLVAAGRPFGLGEPRAVTAEELLGD